jgi:hypothetical protein
MTETICEVCRIAKNWVLGRPAAMDAKTIKAIFMEALEKATPAERDTFLDQACGVDNTLRDRVEALLKTHDRPDALLDRPATECLPEGPAPEPLHFLEPSARPGALGRLGHYEVLEVVGQGGMGIVFRAFDEKLHRVVAIKALLPALAGNGAARQRFVREAQAAAAVSHDHVVSIHAVEDAGPVPYIVMQFVAGCTLQEKLDRTGPLPIKEVLRIGRQVADGLAAAHRQGLIHRDIKPANILLENGIERVKITDFGLARTADDASLTQSGYIAGTPAFMSPEQADGQRIDQRTDLFSFGSVLYTACAGRPPFRAETTLAILRRVCDDTPRPLREINADVPEWLEALIGRLHAKDPADRFAEASQVADVLGRRLAQLQAGGAFEDGPGPGETRSRPVRQRPANRRLVLKLAAAAVGVVVAAAGGWFAYQSGRPGPGDPGPEDPGAPASGRTLLTHDHGVRSLAFSRDGRALAAGGLDGRIYLWDTATWEARGPIAAHPGEVGALEFSPDVTELFSASAGGDTCIVRVWKVATGEPAGTIGGDTRGMWGVVVSPDGRTLACAGWEKNIHLIDLATRTERKVIRDAATRMIRSIVFTPDGSRIVSGGDELARQWDVATGEEVAGLLIGTQGMAPTAFLDGSTVAGWTWRLGQVTVYDLAARRVRASWRAHATGIEGLAASADGRFVASVGEDGVVRVWSVADQTEVATLTGHQGPVYAVAFAPDGRRLVTGGAQDRTVRIWDLPEMCWVTK